MNLVMTGQGRYVEIQGTAEKTPFSQEQLTELQQLGGQGIRQLIQLQKTMLEPRTDLNRLFPLLK
jgi:ribonuclease PH